MGGRIVGITVPKRVICTVCRRVRKTDCSARVEVLGGIKIGESRSITIPLCRECTRDALNALQDDHGCMILGDAVESSVRTLVRWRAVVRRDEKMGR